MKKICIPLLLAALCACTPSRPETADPATSTVAEASVSVSETAPGSAVATEVAVIPDAFLGKWNLTADGCKTVNDGRLTVAADNLSFWESGGKVTSVTVTSPTDITVRGDMWSEGDAWAGSYHMVLSNDGNTLTIDDGKTAIRVRCPN